MKVFFPLPQFERKPFKFWDRVFSILHSPCSSVITHALPSSNDGRQTSNGVSLGASYLVLRELNIFDKPCRWHVGIVFQNSPLNSSFRTPFQFDIHGHLCHISFDDETGS
jgi:hypothetical protein